MRRIEYQNPDARPVARYGADGEAERPGQRQREAHRG